MKQEKIAVIGTGMIGTSIAVMFTGNGYRTTLYAVNDELQEKSAKQYDVFYKALMDKGLVTEKQFEACKKLLGYTQDYNDIADADCVFECAFENVEVKHSVYAEIEKYVKDPFAIISTSSAMSADDLVSGLSKFADRMIVAHPFFPPHLIPYFEVVKSAKTAPGVAERASDLLESAGRKVVVLKKNAPGYIANRLQHALWREAISIVEHGIADAETVDIAIKNSFGLRLPQLSALENSDMVGTQLTWNIHSYVLKDLEDSHEPSPLLKQMLDEGKLGFKSGEGFMKWTQEEIDKCNADLNSYLIHMLYER
jgi:3-hydroxybutyryl-CoA dehydrogenase